MLKRKYIQQVITLSLTIRVYLHSLAVVATQVCEILRNSLKIRTYIVQSSWSSSLVSIESAYATSYQSLVVTLDVYPRVFETLTHLALKQLGFSLFDAVWRRNALHYQHNLCIAEKYIQWATILSGTSWAYLHSFSFVAFQYREIKRNSDKI